MPAPTDPRRDTYQAYFHRRWNHLRDPHVRTLAWLLDAPDLLDPAAPEWQGRIASIGAMDEATLSWLMTIDRDPSALHAWLDIKPFTRLGRYAEKLMAFYLRHQGRLFAHGVQVRAGKNETIGEFDFLLRQSDALVHWEFATKLYLLEASGNGRHADYFVGPNLADTLGAKVRKIMDRQLSLSQHPAAKLHVPEPIVQAQALVKGWLFYHGKTPLPATPAGVSSGHCRGFWCAHEELHWVAGERFAILPRLSWLAPAKVAVEQSLDRHAVQEALASHFQTASTPLLIAQLEQRDGYMLEVDRGFVVPNDWHSRAEQRVKQAG
ncbi:DUF1853 family protein [Noviherbaspirillum autotrophicum]|uniref:DUF1853 domain-containing protein n=1 Tax=Noviherbaspirillum autotrophicum TaxID=709839 RepID=A0A0C1XYL1_9BURK|nr:DUF1853 family protein [Noviherbaspirillum autotrophicum]KIF79858.1 hypothetical protein TSA66_01850 [Noviherbaspirillum autotrophicum]